MKKNNILLLVLIPMVFFLYAFNFYQLDKSLYTIYDEGYFYLTIWKVKNGIQNIGVSQWPYFINSIFNDEITSDILYLRYIGYFTGVFSIISFAIIILLYLKNELQPKEKILYLIVVTLMGYFSLGGIIISFNQIQEFLLLMMIGFFLLSVKYSKYSYWFWGFIGFFSFLSLLIIFPSGLIITIGLFILQLLRGFDNKKIYFTIILFFVGFFISVVNIHFFVVDIITIKENIIDGAINIMGSDRGYNPMSHITRLLFFFRDFFIDICLLIGAYGISLLIKIYTKKWVSEMFFLISILIFTFYQKQPVMYFSSLLAFPILLFAIIQIYNKISFRLIFTSEILILLFLFITPILSAIGTNTALSIKMVAFILPWSVLYIKIWKAQKYKFVDLKFLILIILIVSVVVPFKNVIFENEKLYKFTDEKPISNMKLNRIQKEYFDRVYSILLDYQYRPQKDIIFATTFDHMTICAMDAVPSETFQLPNDFLVFKNKKKIKRPDFIFLNNYDYEMMSDSLAKLNWGFPQNYEKYYVGTPDPDAIWKSERWLYCRKSKM